MDSGLRRDPERKLSADEWSVIRDWLVPYPEKARSLDENVYGTYIHDALPPASYAEILLFACYDLFFETGTAEFQRLGPDLFHSRSACACGEQRGAAANFAANYRRDESGLRTRSRQSGAFADDALPLQEF